MPLVSVIPAVLFAHAHQLGVVASGVIRAVAALGDVLGDLGEQADKRVRLHQVNLEKAEAAVLKAERELDRLRGEETEARRALKQAKDALELARSASARGNGGGGGEPGAAYAARLEQTRAEEALEAAARAVRQAADALDEKLRTRDAARKLEEAALALRGRVAAQVSRERDVSSGALDFGDRARGAADLLLALLEPLDGYLGGLSDEDGDRADLGALRAVAFLAQFAGIAGIPGLGAFAGGVLGVGAALDLLGDLHRGLDGDQEILEKSWRDQVGQKYRDEHLLPMLTILAQVVTTAIDIGGAVGPIVQALDGGDGLWAD